MGQGVGQQKNEKGRKTHVRYITNFSKHHSYPHNPKFYPRNSVSKSQVAHFLFLIRNFFTVCFCKRKLQTPLLQEETACKSHMNIGLPLLVV